MSFLSIWLILSSSILILSKNSLCLPSPSLDGNLPIVGYHTTNSLDSKQDFMESVYADCTEKGSSGSVPCFKYKLFAFVDKILNKDEINLTNGITVIKTTGSVVGIDGAPRSLKINNENTASQLSSGLDETTTKNSDFVTGLINRAERFLKTHTLKVDLRGTDVLNAVSRAGRTLDEISEDFEDISSNDVEEARKKKKGGKILMPLLMMIKMKLLGLIPIALGAIALLAGKALLISKIALLLALLLLLKKLLSHQKSVTYEIVTHPHHSGSSHVDSYAPAASSDYGASASYGGSSHGGWGRSSDSHEMAYSAQKPTMH